MAQKSQSTINQFTANQFSVDEQGFYGEFGGQYAPEVLMPAIEELTSCFLESKNDPQFLAELQNLQRDFVGRPTPLIHCKNLSSYLQGAQIFLKNEGLAHTGAHKINHCLGQVLLAKRMNKKRIIAETGAGQHGLATASVSAKFGLECVVYMGAIDVARQRPNVFWMNQFGATVLPVHSGGKRLKDAVNAALKDWISNVETSHYLLGSCLGPHPFPEINRYFQSVVSAEIKAQIIAQTGRLPDYVIACVGGGSNALGAFDHFLNEPTVKLIGVEAGGKGLSPGQHAVRLKKGKIGVAEGYKSYWLQNDDGQIADTHSISAGLDYAGIGPLHAHLNEQKRVEYSYALDEDVLKAFSLLAKTEGVLAALESSHALAEAIKIAPQLSTQTNIVVNISGRAEKDIFILARALKDQDFLQFTKDYNF